MARKDKWAVYGEYGGTFTNLKDAKRCAKESSRIGGRGAIYLIEDGCHFISSMRTESSFVMAGQSIDNAS